MKNNRKPASFSVRKSSGVPAIFEEAKLRRSLHRSGAEDYLIQKIIQEVQGQAYEGIPTKTLYKIAYKLLKKHNKPIAARYSLKQAMLRLGPSGYPFEHFFAEILRAQGYSARTSQLLMGKCIRHEVDIVAENASEMVFVECKYHAQAGGISDVKVPLYIHARFHDLERSTEIKGELNGRNLRFMIATNTRFSDDAMAYGRCAGLDLISWSYPPGAGLRETIDKAGLHPITCLGSLARHEKATLLGKGIVLCRNLLHAPQVLGKIGISTVRQKLILDEVKGLCATQ
jgi:hypothetical protein